jgi:hypothetical protein
VNLLALLDFATQRAHERKCSLLVIPGRREAASFDVQLHIGESITPGFWLWIPGLALRAIPE